MGGGGILDSIENKLNEVLPDDRRIRVLEAGGGSCTHIRFARDKYVTTLDISPEQLERNSYADERVLGDLESWTSASSYDLIVCWNVLEHLDKPGAALRNMMEALDDGGTLVVGCPNLYSIKGAVTKLSPHWFHVWYYRKIKGSVNAGKPGYAPFRTFLRPDSTFHSVARMARANGLELLIAQQYEGPENDDLKNKSPLLYRLYEAVGAAANGMSGGRFQAKASDWAIVMRKPGGAQPVAERSDEVARTASA